MKNRNTKRLLCLLIVATCLTGCGPSRPATARVTGTITYGGKPVPAGRVCFWPKAGRPAIGEIAPDGTYVLSSFSRGDGAIVSDEFRVSIKASRARFSGGAQAGGAEDGAEGGDAAGRPVIEWLIPRRYERPETSGLTAAVHAGENTINFDLPTEP